MVGSANLYRFSVHDLQCGNPCDFVLSGWAHVVCALYIPEVTFGNNRRMEPIITTKVPKERFSKVRKEPIMLSCCMQ